MIPKARRCLLFAYGSLLPEGPDHGLLADAEPLGPAETPPEYHLVDLNVYPALIRGGPLSVRGQLYAVSAETLRHIDVRKEHPVLFQRTTIRLATGGEAEAYLMKLEQVRGRRRLKVGDWTRRFAPRPVTGPENPWARWARARARKP